MGLVSRILPKVRELKHMEHAATGAYKPRKRVRQRRMRGPAKQKARMSYRKNRGQLKQRAKLRYKQVRNNPRFKRKKTVYRKNRQRYKRLAADEQIALSNPGIEFVMKCGGETKSGYVTGIVTDTWQIEYLLEDGESGALGPDRFFDCVILYDDEDIEVLFNILDQASEVNDDNDDDVTVFEFEEPEDWSEAATSHFAFNKENVPDLMSQLVKVLDKATSGAEGSGRKGLQDASSRVKGMAKAVAKAWQKRNEGQDLMRNSHLRHQLIRLAYHNKHLRPDVLELLAPKGESQKKASDPRGMEHFARRRLKQLLDGKYIRLYADRFTIEIVEVPQKPLKRRTGRTLSIHINPPGQLPFNDFIPKNLLGNRDGAKIGNNDTYDQALKKLQTALAKAEALTTTSWEENVRTKDRKPDSWFPRIQQDEMSYLLVEPPDTKPQTIKGKDFTVESTWINFSSYAPGSDLQAQDPSYTQLEAKSPAAARKFYKILKANPDSLKQLSWGGFSDWLRKNKIPYETHHSSWH